MQEFWSGSFIAALVIGAHRLGPDVLGFIVYRKQRTRRCTRSRPKRTCRSSWSTRRSRSCMVAVLFYFTVTTENIVLKNDAEPGREGRRHRVQVELGLRLRGHQGRRRRRARCTRSATRPRSRSWCLPVEQDHPVHPAVQATSSTRSGCPTSASSATSSRTRRRTTPRTSSRTPSTAPARWSVAVRSSAGRIHSAMNFEVRGVAAGDLRRVHLNLRQTDRPGDRVRLHRGGRAAEAGRRSIPTCGQLCSAAGHDHVPDESPTARRSPPREPSGGN